MRLSENRILTTHVGSLPRPAELTRLYAQRARGEHADNAAIAAAGAKAVPWVIGEQLKAGIDLRVADVFPSPEQDHWYAMLLSVPMNYAPEPAPPRLQRQIPVVPYLDPQDDGYTQSIVWREVAHGVPLVHRALPLFVGEPVPARLGARPQSSLRPR